MINRIISVAMTLFIFTLAGAIIWGYGIPGIVQIVDSFGSEDVSLAFGILRLLIGWIFGPFCFWIGILSLMLAIRNW